MELQIHRSLHDGINARGAVGCVDSSGSGNAVGARPQKAQESCQYNIGKVERPRRLCRVGGLVDDELEESLAVTGTVGSRGLLPQLPYSSGSCSSHVSPTTATSNPSSRVTPPSLKSAIKSSDPCGRHKNTDPKIGPRG